MKTMKLHKPTIAILLLSIAIFLGFQNCSKVNFSKDWSQIDSQVSSSIDGTDAQSVYYTNSNTVPIKVSVQSESLIDQVRVSTQENMENEPWLPVTEKITLDLKDDYASDGSKDGAKIAYVEFRSTVSGQKVTKQLHIFLDTQVPEISGEELLVTGLRGQVFNRGQRVPIRWKISDRRASTGESSGLDSKSGFRRGYSYTNDCSEASLFEKTDWGAANETEGTMSWPTDDPLQAFYICLFAKDRAGNINTFQSQPMTSLWNVLIGDNSQGNGASVISQKVRFKRPDYLALTKNRDLLVRDSEFKTMRVIRNLDNDPARLVEADPMPLLSDTVVAMDEAENRYITSGPSVYIVKKSNPNVPVKIVSFSSGHTEIAIRKYQGTERLLVAYIGKFVKSDPAAEAYIFEVPLTDLLLRTVPLVLADLKTQYKLMGNGMVPPISYSLPTAVTLSKNDPLDVQYSTGFPQGMTTGSAGEIYLSTGNTGSNSGVGNNGIRILTPTANGTFKQTVLNRRDDAFQLSYHKQTLPNGTVKEILLTSANTPCGSVIDLATLANTFPFSGLTKHTCYGAIIEPNAAGTDYTFYLSSVTTSQIFHYDSSYRLIETLGRPVFDSIQDPLAAMIGNAAGIYQAPDGEIYFTDSQNALVRKLDKNGILSTVAGKIQNYAGKDSYNNEPLSEFLLNSFSFQNGWNFQIVADFDAAKNRKVLYLGMVTGQIHALDLVNNTVNTLVKPPTSFRPNWDIPFWAIGGIHFVKGPGDQNLLLTTRSERIFQVRNLLSGYIEGLPVRGTDALGVGTSFMGNVAKQDGSANTSIMNNADVGMNNDLRYLQSDSEGYIYSSGSQFKVSLLSTQPKTRILSTLKLGSFALVEEGTKRHIIDVKVDGAPYLTTLDMTKMFDATKDPILVKNKRLCFPGSSIRSPGQMIIDTDGNLLITDSDNARILKYRLRAADGSLRWNFCP